MKSAEARIAFALALLVLAAGYIVVFRPLESKHSTLYANLDSVRIAGERAAAEVRAIPALTAQRNALRTRLARYHTHDSRAAIVDRFLHAIAAVSLRRGVAIQSVAAEGEQQFHPTNSALKVSPDGDDLHLDLGVRGAYDDVLHAARDLNSIDLATQISVASLGNADRKNGVHPQLNATFHVVLLREPDASQNQTSNHS